MEPPAGFSALSHAHDSDLQEGEVAALLQPRDSGRHSYGTHPPPAAGSSKGLTFFGYVPLRAETIPPTAGKLAANVLAGTLCALRILMVCNGYASIIFLQTADPHSPGTPGLKAMLPVGVKLFVFSSGVGLLWNSLFGRLQYSIADPQGICVILLGQVAASVAQYTTETTSGPTMLWAISIASVITGAGKFAAGKAGLGQAMTNFPRTAVNGFLGALGYELFHNAVALASGVEWGPAWPKDLDAFSSTRSLGQLGAMGTMILALIWLPGWLNACCASPLWKSVITIAPLPVFWAAALSCGGPPAGWMFASPPPESALALWTSRDPALVEWGAMLQAHIFVQLGMIVFIVLLTEPLQFAGIVNLFLDKEPLEGDPDPYGTEGCPVDVDRELTNLGAGNVVLGFAGGVMSYHSGGNSNATRSEGGTHRIAGVVAGCLLLGVFASGAPVQVYIPKFFLAGIIGNIGIAFFMNFIVKPKVSAVDLLKAVVCVLVTAATKSILYGIGVSLLGAMFTTLAAVGRASHVAKKVRGNVATSLVKRPPWERRALDRHGHHETVVLVLHGTLFFGTVGELERTFAAISKDRRVRHLVVDFSDVDSVSASVLSLFSKAIIQFRAVGISLLLSSLHGEILEQFELSAVLERGRIPDVSPFGGVCVTHGARAAAAPKKGPALYTTLDMALRSTEDGILSRWYSGAYGADGSEPPTAQQAAFAAARADGRHCGDDMFATLLGLDPGLVPRLRSIVEVRKLPASGVLVEPGTQANEMYIVRRGRLDTWAELEDGDGAPRRELLLTVTEGAMTGERRFLSAAVNRTRRRAVTAAAGVAAEHASPAAREGGAEVWVIHRESGAGCTGFDDLAGKDPQLHAGLLLAMIRQLTTDDRAQTRANMWKSTVQSPTSPTTSTK